MSVARCHDRSLPRGSTSPPHSMTEEPRRYVGTIHFEPLKTQAPNNTQKIRRGAQQTQHRSFNKKSKPRYAPTKTTHHKEGKRTIYQREVMNGFRRNGFTKKCPYNRRKTTRSIQYHNSSRRRCLHIFAVSEGGIQGENVCSPVLPPIRAAASRCRHRGRGRGNR